jgi:hypothetical protein
VVATGVEPELEVAAFVDLERVGDGGRMVAEQIRHLVAVLHVEAVAIEAETVRVVEVLARADAQQRIVVVVIVGLEVVGVVGGDERQPQVGRHLRQLRVHDVLRSDAVALHLEVVAAVEDGRHLLDELPGGLDLSSRDGAAHHGREASGGRDQPLAALAQQVEIDARLVVEALEVGLRDEVDQVAVPGLVHGDQQQVADRVEARVVALAPFLVEARPGGDVDLTADDRLDVVTTRGLVELDCSEEVAVVRHAHGRHAERLGPREERVDLDGPVQQRVLRVQVQMYERVRQRFPPGRGAVRADGSSPSGATPTRWSPAAWTKCRRPRG